MKTDLGQNPVQTLLVKRPAVSNTLFIVAISASPLAIMISRRALVRYCRNYGYVYCGKSTLRELNEYLIPRFHPKDIKGLY